MLRVFEYRAIKHGNYVGGIINVEYGSELREYCNLPCREEYWLVNNSRRINEDVSFVLSVFELYYYLMNVLFGL